MTYKNMNSSPSSNGLNVGKYSNCFTELEKEKTICLGDSKSDAKSKVHVKATEKKVYKAQPDGELIPSNPGQKKCDYLVYAQNKPQLCFFELKGKEISKAFGQILDTIKYLEGEEDLKHIFKNQAEKHAFIVSPQSQNIPKGGNTTERQLWRKIKMENLHFVKVTGDERYSDQKGRIICSAKAPILMPYVSK